MTTNSNEKAGETVVSITPENVKRLIWSFAFIFFAVNVVFVPDYSLSIPFKTPLEALGGLVSLIFLTSALWNFFKVSYKNIIDNIVSKLNIYSQKDLDNKSSANIALIGMSIWLLAIYSREGVMLAPLVIVGSLVMIWSVMIFFEESVLVKNISSYLSSKIIFGFLSACIIFWATYTTLGQINEIFGVDPSYFPFATTVGIFINVAKVVALTSIVVLPLSLIVSFINMFTSDHPFWSLSRQAILYCTFMLSLIVFQMLIYLWNDEFMHEKLLKSAEIMDMNSNHHCHNNLLGQNNKKVPVIFIGPNSSLVLYKKNDQFDITDCNPLNKKSQADS